MHVLSIANSFVRNRLLALFTFFSPQENKFKICIGLLSPSYKPLLTYDRKMYDVCLEFVFLPEKCKQGYGAKKFTTAYS